MTAGLAGVGCVTPLGCDLATIWQRIEAGERAPVVEVTNPETGRRHLAAPVPMDLVASLAREPRLRRASGISLFAAAAGQAALADSGLELTAQFRQRLAIVLGVSSGGVQYTRRFYEQIVKQGANAASPLLFPETVYNAPASHLAALLGVDGATYTLVGDGTVGLQALNLGAQLLALGDANHVLVVAAEELDWILLEAHRDWRLTATDVETRARVRPHCGALLAEGAAAVLLGNGGRGNRVTIHEGQTCFARAEANAAMDAVLGEMASSGPVDRVVSGGNGSWTDDAIEAAVNRHFPGAARPWLQPKDCLGEALGASGLQEVALAANALARFNARRVLVAMLGWNQQAAAAVVERVA